jgi:hypothetical protein
MQIICEEQKEQKPEEFKTANRTLGRERRRRRQENVIEHIRQKGKCVEVMIAG